MNFELKENKLIISLEGRIDSNTSNDIENDITKIINDNSFEQLVLGFENVEFLSSAGLRVILRLKKKYNNISVINVVPEVYDVFEMTGFTEMMDIQKGFRKLSIEGAEEIGRGANGIVYRYANDMIVKVYFNNAALEDIRNEIRLAKKAFVSGVSTAIPFDIVKVGQYYGSVFEMIQAQSISKLINKHPEKIDEYISLLVELLKTMNSNVVEDGSLPTIKDKAIRWIDTIKDFLSADELTKLNNLFNGIPNDNFMVHRDYHIKNLLMQQDELILIDMDTLSRGSVIFELVGIYNAYKGFVEIKEPGEPDFLGIDNETSYYIWNKILELYFDDKSKEELQIIEEKISLVSTVQLLKIHTNKSKNIVAKERKAAELERKLHYLINKVNDLVL